MIDSITKPAKLILNVTSECNLRCLYCKVWKTKREGRRLTFDKKKDILNNFMQWHKGGDCIIYFGGGEPFIKKEEMLELAKFVSGNGRVVAVSSNGFFIDGKLAEKIAYSGLNKICISLDGFSPETHDYIRGVKGSHKKAIQALSFLNRFRKKLSVLISTVVMTNNMIELSNLASWAMDNRLDGILFQPVVLQIDYAVCRRILDVRKPLNKLWPRDMKRVNYAVDALINMKEKGYPIKNPIKELEDMKIYFKNPAYFSRFQCNAGLDRIRINEVGEMRLCPYLPPIGNIWYSDLRDIWRSGKADTRREEIKNCKRSCKVSPCNRYYYK